MSTRVTRAEARRRMAALQEPRPGQGWSETRPTRAPRRALKRTRDEDSAPEPVVSSDSDVEVIGDPAVEERKYAAEDPSPREEDEDEPRAPSPPRWLPEVPPTPRYEGEWLTDGARDGDDGAPLATPPWRPARPPTPRYTEPRRPEEQTQSEESTAQPMPQPQEEDIHQARAEEPSVVRTEVPAAHVSHSTRAFEAEGMRWRQQTVTWTWPEGPATGPAKEPTGCVGPADTKYGPANTGDDGSDGGGGVAGERTVGVARATGHPKTDVAAARLGPRIDAPAAAVHAASFGPGGRRLARGRQERVAGGYRGSTRGRDGTAEGRQAVRPGLRRREEVPEAVNQLAQTQVQVQIEMPKEDAEPSDGGVPVVAKESDVPPAENEIHKRQQRPEHAEEAKLLEQCTTRCSAVVLKLVELQLESPLEQQLEDDLCKVWGLSVSPEVVTLLLENEAIDTIM
ncbi:voltage-dependent calcium channel beta subunit-associated regulatory protein-like [Drosophila subpulchrella]|uniref:voltage-dependent calcium channel beta subunit-associated regulatory protein-like n=1 Tax=Drosophila subpulchrella TaxID=1486046 RepID=UPI0018A16432|nr:voltage-dependent calcium channel beta subunit-associated regulatory protein-like [Drosophila subpulchrella]